MLFLKENPFKITPFQLQKTIFLGNLQKSELKTLHTSHFIGSVIFSMLSYVKRYEIYPYNMHVGRS